MTPAQAAMIRYFAGLAAAPAETIRPATYRALEAHGWIEPCNEWPYHRTTPDGLKALAEHSRPNAAVISRLLSRAGVQTSHARTRQGRELIEVKQRSDSVRVVATFALDSDTVAALDAVEEVLSRAGYRIERNPGAMGLTVTTKGAHQ